MKVQLKVTEAFNEKDKGKTFTFDKYDHFRVGRHPDVHFQIPNDPYVSRFHLDIEITPLKVYLKDTDSTNGTEVNGKKVKDAVLNDGDIIGIGRTKLKVELVLDKEEQKKPPMPVYCLLCKRDVTDEAGIPENARRGKLIIYICKKCRGEEKSAPEKAVEEEIVPGYKKISELGRGGMGVVYKVEKISTGGIFALKTILPECPMDEHSRKMFLREIEVMSELKHPNIVKFYENGEHKGKLWFSMEFIEGTDVWKMVRGGMAVMKFRPACEIISQVLDGLDYAHKKNFIHRDIKPQNIMVSKENLKLHAKLMDFGLAKNFLDAGGSRITKIGEVAGTIPFMAPEQVLDYKYAQPPCDIYSVGASLYFMITGAYTRDFPNKDAMLYIVRSKPVPVRERNSDIPMELARIIDKSIEQKPEDRFSTAWEMKKALDRIIPEL